MLGSLRKLAQKYYDSGQYLSCIFWTEKALCLSKEKPGAADIILYIRSLLATNQFQRALSFLNRKNLPAKHLVYRYFAAEALFLSKRFEDVAGLLESGQKIAFPSKNGYFLDIFSEDSEILDELEQKLNIQSASLLLLARTYLELENRGRTAALLQRCLKDDPYCYEALDILLKEHLVSRSELDVLVNKSLEFPPDNEGISDVAELAQFIYGSKLNTEAGKFGESAAGLVLPTCKFGLFANNLTLRLSDAQSLYYNGHFKKAYDISRRILEEEEFYDGCVPLHVCILVELEKKHELFLMAHKLVDMFPDQAVSWFAVGAYYYLLGNQDAAKKFLIKMTGMRPTYGPGWLLLGHAFAAEQEHDQAINCYLKATKLLSGCHLPLMYVGVEYGISNNLVLCEKFLNEAVAIAPNDPYVLNELGVVLAKKASWKNAVVRFFEALDRILGDGTVCKSFAEIESWSADCIEKRLDCWIPPVWEPMLTNLGNVYIQLDVKKAIVFHRKALELSPHSSKMLGNLGMSYLANMDLEMGIEYLHKSLSIRSEIGFQKLLSDAMDMVCENNWALTVPDSEKERNYLFVVVPEFEKDNIFKVPTSVPKRKRSKETADVSMGDGDELGNSKNDSSSSRVDADGSLSGIDEVDMET